MSKIVVFGANGFIGRHLVRALAKDKNNEIVAFDFFSKQQPGLDNPFIRLSNVHVVAGDFLNRDDVSNALIAAEFVFHLVSSTNPVTSSKDPFIDIDTNIRGSIELFDLCIKHGVKKIIFPSSGGTVYGDIDSERIKEDVFPQPRSPYGIGKLTIENYLRYFKYISGLNYIVYRIANPYGPGQNIYGKQGVIPIFMHRYLLKQPISVYGDGSMVRDYLYIDDLIKLIIQTYAKINTHNEYNLGSGQGYTINELIANIEDCTGYTVKRQRIETPATFVQRSVMDITRFQEEFGAQTFTPLGDGIARTWHYVKKLR